jgi:hypothetical protein
MRLNIENLDQMAPAEAHTFWAEFAAELANDNGQAAKEHLQAGRAIYLCEDDTPAGLVVKEYPDGRRELVQFDQDGEKVVRGAA